VQVAQSKRLKVAGSCPGLDSERISY
jgi:hypothetical protein